MRLDKQRDTLLTGRGAAGPRFVDGYLAYLLAQASQRISAEFHLQVKAAGLSVTEWRVLASLEGSPGETIGTLAVLAITKQPTFCLLYTSPSPRDLSTSRMPSSA